MNTVRNAQPETVEHGNPPATPSAAVALPASPHSPQHPRRHPECRGFPLTPLPLQSATLPQHPTLRLLLGALQPYAVIGLLVQISRGSTVYPSDAPAFEPLSHR